MLSDAVIILDIDDGIAITTDKRVGQTAAELRRVVLAERIGTPEQVRWKQQMALAQWRQRNVPGGYWIAGSRPHAADAADPRGERWPRYQAGDDAPAAICTLRHDRSHDRSHDCSHY
jgi:hypothetical protein